MLGNEKLTPSKEEQAHSQKLCHALLQQMKEHNGIVSFHHFMQEALYSPGMGYYVAGQEKFGRQGDFITAPERSPLFGQCLASQCAAVLPHCQNQGVILEIGAGSGALAESVLCALHRRNALPSSYLILELGAELAARQKERLKATCPFFYENIEWVSAWPEDIEGVVLANEVLDAMPVHRFHYQQGECHEMGVCEKAGRFEWCYMPQADARIAQSLDHVFLGREDAFVSEINLMLPAWMNSLYHAVKKGVVLLMDYGCHQADYYHPERSRGSLRCFYRHHLHTDPLILLGLQDITANVNFTQVACAAASSGFDVLAYSQQAQFLLASELLAHARVATHAEPYQVAQQVKQLTMPTEMGECFKVMVLGKDWHTDHAWTLRDVSPWL